MQLSFDLSEYTADVNGVGTLRLLDAIRTCGLEKRVRLYQVNTSTHAHTYLCGHNNLEHDQFMSYVLVHVHCQNLYNINSKALNLSILKEIYTVYAVVVMGIIVGLCCCKGIPVLSEGLHYQTIVHVCSLTIFTFYPLHAFLISPHILSLPPPSLPLSLYS